MSQKYSITIIGCGPVGALCASYMAKRGFHVTLYEKREDVRQGEATQGKSINLAMSYRAMKALSHIGLQEFILKNSVPMKGRCLHHNSGKCSLVPYDIIEDNCLYSISRKLLNELLISAAEENTNVKIYFNHQLLEGDLVSGMLTMKNLKTQKIFQVNSDFIIGADGAHSTLRGIMQQTPMFSTSQTYIKHGYFELSINPRNGKTLIPKYLHIWPRGEFMMIALPNCDGSWTVTLFMPFERFEELNSEDNVLNFFRKTFPDSIPLLGGGQELSCLKLKPRALMTVTCDPFHVGEKSMLIGDAAHAMVPFYGQGLNAGFEDCLILDEILDYTDNSFGEAVKEFTRVRKPDAHAICELSVYNYREMRELVLKVPFRIRKKLDEILYRLFSKTWIPLYTSVTFTDMRYEKCAKNRQWQDKLLKNVAYGLAFVLMLTLLMVLY